MAKYSYENCVSRYSDKFIRVLIDNGVINSVENLAKEIIKDKEHETHHQIDNNKELKRFTNGILGEAAIENLLGIPIRNWQLRGNSKCFNTPDIPGYNVGIKTVEYGKFPIIFKNNTYPQIICIRSKSRKDLFFVCGLATQQVLNTYQDMDLILDTKLRERGTKTGFYGFEHLKPIKSLEDLKEFRK